MLTLIDSFSFVNICKHLFVQLLSWIIKPGTLCWVGNGCATYAMGHCPHRPTSCHPSSCSGCWQLCSFSFMAKFSATMAKLVSVAHLSCLLSKPKSHDRPQLTNTIAIQYSALPHPIVLFQNLPITNFTSSRCHTNTSPPTPSSLPAFVRGCSTPLQSLTRCQHCSQV